MYEEDKKNQDQSTDRELLQLLELLSQIPEAPVPEEFDLRLRRALKQEAEREKRLRRRKRLTAVAACLAIGLLSVRMMGGVGLDTASDLSGMEDTPKTEYSDAVSADGMPSEGAASGEAQGAEETLENGMDLRCAQIEEPGLSAYSAQEKNLENKETETDSAGKPDTGGESETISDGSSVSDTAFDSEAGGTMLTGAAAGGGFSQRGEAPSRGELSSLGRDAFDQDCEQVVQWMAEGIEENDAQKLVQAVTYKNNGVYSDSQAQQVLKLYSDLFAGGLTYKRVNLTAWSGNNIYRLSDGSRELLVLVSSTPEGLKLSEPVMEACDWLYQQMEGEEFTLLEVTRDAGQKQVEFCVQTERVEEEADTGSAGEGEMRKLIWKETESL